MFNLTMDWKLIRIFTYEIYYNVHAKSPVKTITATEFKAKCLRVIREMDKDHEPVTITRRGQPVAMLTPYPKTNETPSIIGAMRGSVIFYNEPFEPAAEPSSWTECRDRC